MRKRNAIMLAVPNRIVPTLTIAAIALVIVYVVLMATTIFFAAWQTQLARGIDDTRARIHALETDYYRAIAKIDSTNPASVGLVAPQKVEYVVAARVPGLSFANR